MKQETVSDYSSLERKKWVMSQYLAGFYPYQIREEYQSKYNLSTHSYDADVVWVNTQLRKKGMQDIEAVVEKHLDFYYDNYRLAREKGDIRSANQSLRQIEDLLKIHKPNTSTGAGGVNIQFNHSSNNISLPSMTVEQMRELLGKKASTGVSMGGDTGTGSSTIEIKPIEDSSTYEPDQETSTGADGN